jgi:predicted outer membrane protein
LLTTLASSLLLATAIPACGDNEDNDDEVNDAIDEGNSRGDALANNANDELGDQPEFDQMSMAAAIVLAIDLGEVMHSELALDLDVTADPEVDAFANQMITVHTDHADQVEAMANAMGFDLVDGEVTTALMRDVEAMMRTMQTSSDVARVYMRQQVVLHETGRIIVEELIDQVDDGEFQDFLEMTRDTIEEHREHAIDLLRGF